MKNRIILLILVLFPILSYCNDDKTKDKNDKESKESISSIGISTSMQLQLNNAIGKLEHQLIINKETFGSNVDKMADIKENTTEDFDTYFVGKEEIWVHNGGCGKSLLLDELEVGTYRELKDLGEVGDNLTPHHIPFDAFMSFLKSLLEYAQRLKYYTKEKGICINLEAPSSGSGRHHRAYTFGKSLTYDPKGYFNKSPKEALEFDLDDMRQILKEDGLYNEAAEKALQKLKSEVIQTYKIF